MKKDWDVKSLGEVCEVVGGGTPKTGIPEYWSDEVTWVTPKDLGRLKTVKIFDTTKHISQKGLEKSSAKLLPKGAVVMSSRAPIGYVAIAGTDLATNQGCRNFICSDKIFNKYLYYYIVANTELLNSLGGGATFKEISGTTLKGIELPVPPLQEQKRIVKILDEKFGQIDELKKIAEQQIIDAKELFESRLNEVFSTKVKTWSTANLEDHIRFIDYRGRTPKKTKKGIRLITAKNIKKGFLQIEPQEFIAKSDYKSWMTSGVPIKGDVLFTTEAPLANVAKLDTDERVAFAQRTIIFQMDRDKLNPDFLFYLMLSKPVQDKVLSFGSGATVQGIKSSLLKKIPINFPGTLKEQKEIAEELDKLLGETKDLEVLLNSKLSDLEELKKSYLQDAFAGKL